MIAAWVDFGFPLRISWVKVLIFVYLKKAVAETSPHILEIAEFAHDYFSSRLVSRMAAFACDEIDGIHLFRTINEGGRMQIAVRVRAPNFTDLIENRFTGVLLLMDCPTVAAVLEESSQRTLLFNSSAMWLLVGVSDTMATLGRRVPVRLDSEVTVAQRVSGWNGSHRWKLSEVYRLDPNRDLVTRSAGFWDSFYGFMPPWDNCLTSRRRNISGVGIRTALFLDRLQPSEKELRQLALLNKDDSIKQMTNMAKHSHLVHLAATQMFNISVSLMQNLDPGQLNPRPGEKFNGILGYVERGDAEVLASGMILTLGRWRIITFGAILWKLRSVFIFLAPSALGSLNALAKPFSTEVWVGLFLVSILVFILNAIVSSLQNEDDQPWGTSLTSVIGTLSSQGFYVEVATVPGRSLVLSFEVFCLIAYGFYSAAVVTFLLRPPETTIRTPRDMMSEHFKSAIHDWLHTVRSVSNSTDPLVSEVWEQMIKPPRGLGVWSVWQGAALLRRPRSAYFGADVALYQSVSMASFTQAEICRLREVELEPDLYVSLGLRKSASVVPYMQIAVVVLLERGIVNRELRIWRERRPTCLQGEGHVTGAVGMESIVPAVAILVLGMFVSTLLFYLEVWRWKRAVMAERRKQLDTEEYLTVNRNDLWEKTTYTTWN